MNLALLVPLLLWVVAALLRRRAQAHRLDGHPARWPGYAAPAEEYDVPGQHCLRVARVVEWAAAGSAVGLGVWSMLLMPRV